MERIRKMLLLVLVLAYTGQALASVVPLCPEMAQSGAALHGSDMTVMEHAGHQMSPDSSAAGGCCDGGLCKMSHCQLAPALPLNHSDSNRIVASFYTAFTQTSFQPHPFDSLYRPPISR
jgi:hypothetical protein